MGGAGSTPVTADKGGRALPALLAVLLASPVAMFFATIEAARRARAVPTSADGAQKRRAEPRTNGPALRLAALPRTRTARACSRSAAANARRGRYFGAALLPAGAADEGSAVDDGAALSGEAGGGELPPHAETMAPIVAMAARRATIAVFFMIVFLLRGSRATSRTRPLMPQLCLGSQLRSFCCTLRASLPSSPRCPSSSGCPPKVPRVRSSFTGR
jgi:hypothetical protein